MGAPTTAGALGTAPELDPDAAGDGAGASWRAGWGWDSEREEGAWAGGWRAADKALASAEEEEDDDDDVDVDMLSSPLLLTTPALRLVSMLCGRSGASSSSSEESTSLTGFVLLKIDGRFALTPCATPLALPLGAFPLWRGFFSGATFEAAPNQSLDFKEILPLDPVAAVNA